MHFKLRKKDKLNILIANSTHEAVETSLAKTGHNFYGFRHESFKTWNHNYRVIPGNYFLSNIDVNNVDLSVYDIDIVLAQNIFSQVQVLRPISQKLGVPLIRYGHTLPLPQWMNDNKAYFDSLGCDKNIFITNFNKQQWGLGGEVIHHGIDTELFKPFNDNRDNRLLSVVNLWKDRDFFCGYRLWKEITNGLPVKVVGDNPGMSEPCKTVEELVSTYNSCNIFVNTSLWSPVPHSLLEAAACGCAIISTRNCSIPDYFTHGHDALLSNDKEELGRFCIQLLKDPDKVKEFGRNARKTIVDNLNESKFIQHWNKVFWETYETKHL